MTTNATLKNQLDKVRYNPISTAREILNGIESGTEGNIRFVDPNNPVIYALEAAIALSTGCLEESFTNVSRLYPSAATTYEDLYRHMADIDYINRFSTPSRTRINLLFDFDELKSKAKLVPNGVGLKRFTVPRNTEVTVANTSFTMQYPINIDFLPYGGVSITYDNSSPSPVQSLNTNIVDHGFGKISGVNILNLAVPMYQMKITSQVLQLNNLSSLSKAITFSDKFYYCRAYVPNSDGGWVEISTTHTDQVYDVNSPTVTLKLLNQELSVSLPQIYFNNGLVTSAIKIDIYTTKGVIENFNLSGYSPDAYSIRWQDTTGKDSIYSQGIKSLGIANAVSDSIVSGGSNEMSFSQLRNRVILRSTIGNGQPITPNQIRSSLEDSGYELVVAVDNITNRQFLATRDLPEPANKSTINAAGTTIEKFTTVIKDIVNDSAIADHQNRVTILPSAVFYKDKDILKLLPNSEVERLTNINVTTPEALSSEVNKKNYLYTPFHYALDLNSDQFNARAYHMTQPKVTSKFFVQSNPTVLVSAKSSNHEINYIKDNTGYRMRVVIEGDKVFNALDLDQIAVQLTYSAGDSTFREWIEGKMVTPIDGATGKPVDDLYVYEFLIESGFDIDKSHRLLLNPSSLAVDLTHDFDLVVLVKNQLPDGYTTSDIDTIANPMALANYTDEDIYLGIMQEKFVIEFGQHLEKLWARSNSVGSPQEFVRYEEDVINRYTTDVLKRKPDGTLDLTYNSDTQELEVETIHFEGDIVYDDNGKPTLLHSAGDIVYEYGQPLRINQLRDVTRYIDLFLVDGRYYFATDPQSIEHRVEVENLVKQWVTEDLVDISTRLIEQSELYFHPRSSVGDIKVEVKDNQLATVSAVQSLKVVYYIDERGFDNIQLREAIIDATVRGLKQVLSQSTLSKSDLINHLTNTIGYDVQSVEVNGFLDDKYPAIKLLNKSETLSIGKKLVPLSNQTTRVIDDVEVEFIEL